MGYIRVCPCPRRGPMASVRSCTRAASRALATTVDPGREREGHQEEQDPHRRRHHGGRAGRSGRAGRHRPGRRHHGHRGPAARGHRRRGDGAPRGVPGHRRRQQRHPAGRHARPRRLGRLHRGPPRRRRLHHHPPAVQLRAGRLHRLVAGADRPAPDRGLHPGDRLLPDGLHRRRLGHRRRSPRSTSTWSATGRRRAAARRATSRTFPAGNIALLQRGTCDFAVKADNAIAAGASAVIVFNQGNVVPGDAELVASSAARSTPRSGRIPVVSTSFAQGAEWATTPGLELSHHAPDQHRAR